MLRFKFKNFSDLDLQADGPLAISAGFFLAVLAILVLATTGVAALAIYKLAPLLLA